MPINDPKYRGIIFIIIASAFWGMSAVVLIPRLLNLPVVFAVMIQHLIPLFLLSVLFPHEITNAFKISLKDLLLLSAIALFAGLLGTLAIVKALFIVHFKQLSVVVLIQKIQPVFAIILACIFLREKITKSFIFISLLVFVGVYLITFGLNRPSLELGSDYLMAYFLSIVSALSFASNTVIGKYLTATLPNTTITFMRYLLTTVFSVIACILSGQLFCFGQVTLGNLIIIVVTAFTAGPASMFLYYYGLKYVKASVSSIAELALPFSVIILDYLINRNTLSPVQWLGAIIIVAGITTISLLKAASSEMRQNADS